MKKCPKCGVENKNDAKFCNECGASFEVKKEVVTQDTNDFPVDNEGLAGVKKAFKFFVYVPAVFLVILLSTLFILGIVFVATYDNALYLVIFWLGGGVFAVLGYFIMKISFSYKILSIYYARKNNIDINSIKEELSKKTNQE